ncbi:MAG: hypothetical protein KatS3mg124_1184 [Porticoccaceae bacterium]|nr:MAG: hypothetical protein KatS3mg124_1184 [Porticoccaceae bacterium]
MSALQDAWANAGIPTSRRLRAGRRSAGGHRAPGGRAGSGPCRPDASRGDGLGQDLHHRQRDRPGAAAHHRARPQQDPGGAALRGVSGILPGKRGGVLRLLLRLLPAGSLRAGVGHLHRKGRLHQPTHRADAPVGHQGAPGAARRDRGGHGLVHLRPGGSRALPEDGAPPGARRPHRSARHPAPPGGAAVQPQRPGLPPRHLPGAGGRDRHLPRRFGGAGAAGGALRRRDRDPLPVRSSHRGTAGPGAPVHHLPEQPLRHAPPGDPRCLRKNRRGTARAARRARAGGQAGGGPAPGRAHPLRPGNAPGARLLHRHRELLPLPVGAAAGGAAADPLRLPAARLR